VLAAGGSKGEIGIWDTEENEATSSHFTPFLDKKLIPDLAYDDVDDDV
jgi:hypothetical protein